MVYQPGSNCFSNRHSLSDGEYNKATNPGGCRYWNTSNMATSGGYVFMPTLVSCDGQGGNPTGSGPDGNTNNHGGLAGITPTTPITCRVNCLPDIDALEACDLTVPVSLASLSFGNQEICWLNESGQSTIKANLETYLGNGGDLGFGQEAFDAFYNEGHVDFEEKIINNLTGKAKCIYDKIEQQNGVRMILNKFQEEESPAKLKLELASLGNAFGNTIAPDTNDLITIQINSDTGFWGVGYQPNVMLSLTVFHEIIHAEFYRELVEAIGAGNYTNATVSEMYTALLDHDFFTLYSHIRTYKDWSHNFMANHYRDTLARAIQEYDTGIALLNTDNPDQLYLDLAWRGLRDDGSTASNPQGVVAWLQLTQEERANIDSVINNYVNANLNQTCN